MRTLPESLKLIHGKLAERDYAMTAGIQVDGSLGQAAPLMSRLTGETSRAK